ncbi:hypothetical protein LIER_21315 [Lithospermum erythrorhizon]|uniref:Uncharacterized protein n=1 Tax=Lithospermum erythrorhizon TaxID=34254 RepID=A0AAV3QTX2_LITER
MEETLEDFVGSLLRDNPEAPPTTTSLDFDDSQVPLDVQPLRSRMGPPLDKVRALVTKSSKGKSCKEPPTLEEVKAKTVFGLITDYQLLQIRNHYGIPEAVKTRILLEGESVDTPSTKTDLPQEPEALSEGELLSLKHFSGECVMPHKVNFKAVTTCKDPLARISKRKNVAISESSSGVPPLAPTSKKSRKATKKAIPEDTPVITEVITEPFNPPSLVLLPPATITISDNTPALDIVTSAQESSPTIPSLKASSSSAALEKQLSMRPPPEVVIERFKEGHNYKDLLIDETVSIMKTFSLKVYEEFPSIHSMFPEFMEEHFGEEYVVPLTDTEDESENDGNEAQSDDGLVEDEEGGGDGDDA